MSFPKYQQDNNKGRKQNKNKMNVTPPSIDYELRTKHSICLSRTELAELKMQMNRPLDIQLESRTEEENALINEEVKFIQMNIACSADRTKGGYSKEKSKDRQKARQQKWKGQGEPDF